MDVKTKDSYFETSVDELFNYLLRVEGLVGFLGCSQYLNETEAKEILVKFIDHYVYCIDKYHGFKSSVSVQHYRYEYLEDIQIFKTLTSYIVKGE